MDKKMKATLIGGLYKRTNTALQITENYDRKEQRNC